MATVYISERFQQKVREAMAQFNNNVTALMKLSEAKQKDPVVKLISDVNQCAGLLVGAFNTFIADNKTE